VLDQDRSLLGLGPGCLVALGLVPSEVAVAREQSPDLLQDLLVVALNVTIRLAPDTHWRTTSFERISTGAYASSAF
jgi:hypothetical protein